MCTSVVTRCNCSEPFLSSSVPLKVKPKTSICLIIEHTNGVQKYTVSVNQNSYTAPRLLRRETMLVNYKEIKIIETRGFEPAVEAVSLMDKYTYIRVQ
jgi:hypothetical protein